ncbi:Lipoyl synthase [Buchnera aphidicola (Mindarus abietinus)]
MLKKPNWIKIKVPTNSEKIDTMINRLRKKKLNSVCEEAKCPNLRECFNNGTATFMILGKICTRKCPFCAILNGRPMPIDKDEPKNLALTIHSMNINYVVITSVARDDLRDGGAKHFLKCIKEIRKKKNIKIEILVPDFRKKVQIALDILELELPDIFNHNLENVPRLYSEIRPGANYFSSLNLLNIFKIRNPNIPTKSGLMLGLGETEKEVIQVMKDLRNNGVNMITIGQYLQPSKFHLTVKRYITPQEFKDFQKEALSMGFTNAFCGPFVRSSYHAKDQIKNF